MGIVVKVKTTVKPDYYICSWRNCEHNREMECHRAGGPEIDETGQCLSIANPESEEAGQ
jgi:hypothetical protein